MIEIFIETSSTSRGYDWFDAKPPIFNDSVKQLVDTEFESLILYRKSDQLILAVTALKSGRTDNRTRPIRNSLIWIADNDDEAKIRAIIYEYLTAKNELEKEIAKAITETPEIKIDYQKIKSFGDETQVKSASLPPSNLAYKIGNLDNCKKELINEIKSYSLPKEDGLLILITDSKSQKTFEELKSWRGLSNQISGGEWINIANEKKKSTSLKDLSESQKSLKKNNKESKQSNLLSIVLAIVLIVSNVFWFYQYNDLNKRYDSLKNEFEQSKIQIETLNKDLDKQIKDAKDKFEKAFIKAQEQFNNDIADATFNYQKEVEKVEQSLKNSIEKLN